MEDEDGEMVNATDADDDGEDEHGRLGKSTFSYTVDRSRCCRRCSP